MSGVPGIPAGLPPLAISSGPSSAEGQNSSGGFQGGNLSFGQSPTWGQNLSKYVPLAIAAGAVWWLLLRKK